MSVGSKKKALSKSERHRTWLIQRKFDQEERLTAVIFDLIRDEMPFGRLNSIVMDLEKNPPPYKYGDATAESGALLARGLAQRILASASSPR